MFQTVTWPVEHWEPFNLIFEILIFFCCGRCCCCCCCNKSFQIPNLPRQIRGRCMKMSSREKQLLKEIVLFRRNLLKILDAIILYSAKRLHAHQRKHRCIRLLLLCFYFMVRFDSSALVGFFSCSSWQHRAMQREHFNPRPRVFCGLSFSKSNENGAACRTNDDSLWLISGLKCFHSAVSSQFGSLGASIEVILTKATPPRCNPQPIKCHSSRFCSQFVSFLPLSLAGSVYRDEFDLAILKMQEDNRLEILKRKWWDGGKCPKEEDHRAKGFFFPPLNPHQLLFRLYLCLFLSLLPPPLSPLALLSAGLGMENIGGIFVVLVCGLLVAIFMAVLEFVWMLRQAPGNEVREGYLTCICFVSLSPPWYSPPYGAARLWQEV